MPGGYFDDDQNDKMKALLYPYLMDKAKRRATQTSGPAYAAREQEYRKDEDTTDQRNLGGLWAKSAASIGTIGGKSAKTNLPEFAGQMNASDQQRTDNLFKERAAEEGALGTDLRVAGFIGDQDYRDKDLKRRSADAALDRESRLAAAIEGIKEKRAAEAESGRRFNLTYDQGERRMSSAERNNAENRRIREKAVDRPNNPAMQGPGSIIPGYVDADGNPMTYNPKTGAQGSLRLPPGAKSTKISTDPQTKANEKISQDYATQAAKADGVANMIDSKVNEIQKHVQTGDKAQALALAKNMVKDLNSTFGPDAIGAQEQERLAAFLNNLRMDVLGGNVGLGPDVEAFIEQAKGTSRAVHGGAQTNFKKSQEIRERGLQIGSGEAPSRKLVKEQRSKISGKIKRIYDDGTEEIVDGPK